MLPGVIKVTRKGSGWFAPTHEFLQHKGDNLTLVPVSKPKRITWVKGLWLRYSPEFLKKRKRKKSQLKFLDRISTFDSTISPIWRSNFGSDFHIAFEKQRVMQLPPIEYNDFDCKRRSWVERAESLEKIIRKAIMDSTKSEG